MKKRRIKNASLFLCFLIFSQCINVAAYADDNNSDLGVEARSALLIEPNSGKIIFQKDIHSKFAPASVTKIMTMLLTMEAIDSGKIKLNDKVSVSDNAKQIGKLGSTMLLESGEMRTVEELLKGVAIASGNDAAVALAEYVAGSEEAFVKLMNEKAKELGMKDTTFKNCSGLPEPGHVSSANDIALMSRELLKHKKILKYTGTYMETISEGRLNPIGLVNHNKLVRFYKGCDGLKTGYTSEAKYCISATAVRNNIRMLAVIMGAPTYKIRNRDASRLMNYGFSKFESKKIFDKDSEIEKINLNKKGSKFFIVKAKDECRLIIERGKENKIEKKCIINKDKKEFKSGEIVGTCEIYMNEELITKIPIYSDRDIRTYGVLDNLKNNLMDLFDKAV